MKLLTKQDVVRYTLIISHQGNALVTRHSNNLSRLIACLSGILEYDYPNASGEIWDSVTQAVVRRARRSVSN